LTNSSPFGLISESLEIRFLFARPEGKLYSISGPHKPMQPMLG